MLCVSRDLEQRGGTGAEQEVVDDLLVLESQPGEFMWNREDHMEVADHGAQGNYFRVGDDAGVEGLRSTTTASIRRIGLHSCTPSRIGLRGRGRGSVSTSGALYSH